MAHGLGIIGNCSYNALLRDGSVEWLCWPRPDSSFVFGPLLDRERGGAFVVEGVDATDVRQEYVENTNVLRTVFRGPGGEFALYDFAPRFQLYQRFFKPSMLIRILRPLSGEPRARVRCRPTYDYGLSETGSWRASNHIEYKGFPTPVRLTTNVPLTYVEDERPFLLEEDRHLVLTWGEPLEAGLEETAERFLERTLDYWRRWVKGTRVPRDYQREVVRSALALKLHQYEDTGALLAATTTSLPEHPGSGRTWDYRFCWLRDAFYVLGALRLLGHFEEREAFVQYLINIVASSPDLDLAPLYRIDGSSELSEQILTHWAGFDGDGPVRIGNEAALQRQHDVFGEMVMALSPIFLDDRFQAEQSTAILELLTRLADKAIEVAGKPDAGIWEQRREACVQTFSSLMSWAAADRMALVASRHLPTREAHYRAAADRIRADIQEHAWAKDLESYVSTFGGKDLDAALLQMAPLRFGGRTDERLRQTIDAIGNRLGDDGWLFRYREDDGLGLPTVAFAICTFWMVEALAQNGRHDRARELFERTLGALSPLGLLSEDVDPRTRKLYGNFPQAYSHVGLIHAAFAVAPPWHEVL
ncbi:MAG: glycoside hydrolase family 15 protein [Actinobacteria bacterium]|nr:glycoside hydrolase family 15 protein [Actinomycetota bacterium]